jgi:NAD(P)-dependent dehydrogenase (short-subunit alcohol dehydrogenase family)
VLANKWPHTKTHISILDVNEVQGEQVVRNLLQDFPGTTFSFHHGNVTSWESQRDAFAQVAAKHGRLDIVCANAGVAEKGAFLTFHDEPAKPNMLSCDINFYGVLYSE